MLTEQIKYQIKNYALNKPNEEICGLGILKDNDVSIFPCRNDSPEPHHHFILNTIDYLII